MSRAACETCGKTFKSKENLKMHVLAKHSKSTIVEMLVSFPYFQVLMKPSDGLSANYVENSSLGHQRLLNT